MTRIDRFKVKTRMEQLGIVTFEELAKVAGIHSNTVYNALDGYNWRSQTLDALAKALRCDPTDILTVDTNLSFANAPAPKKVPKLA
jgi:DNA-binding Xre family transcriptional regulator